MLSVVCCWGFRKLRWPVLWAGATNYPWYLKLSLLETNLKALFLHHRSVRSFSLTRLTNLTSTAVVGINRAGPSVYIISGAAFNPTAQKPSREALPSWDNMLLLFYHASAT